MNCENEQHFSALLGLCSEVNDASRDFKKLCRFLIETHTAEEIVRLIEAFSENNGSMNACADAYSDEYIQSVSVIETGEKRFVFPKEDAEKLSPEHKTALEAIAKRNELVNPVYIELDSCGTMIVDC